MSERRDDEPHHIHSLDSVVAVLQERIANAVTQMHQRFDALRIQQSEFESETRNNHRIQQDVMKHLEFRERERNGNIAKLFERFNKHDEWHGPHDAKIGERLGTLETRQHDAAVILAAKEAEAERVEQAKSKRRLRLKEWFGLAGAGFGAVAGALAIAWQLGLFG